jgi:hypothetical protein
MNVYLSSWVLNVRNGLWIVQVYIGALKGTGDVWEWEDGTAWNFSNFLSAGGGLSNTCVANSCILCIVYFPLVTI